VEDDLDFLENKDQFDMQESVSDILKKFKEDQDRILSEGLTSDSARKRRPDLDDRFHGQDLYDDDEEEQIDQRPNKQSQIQQKQHQQN